MSLTDAFVGLVKTVANRGKVERLIREVGWPIDERHGGTLGLHFKCSVASKKTVYIGNCDDPLVLFIVFSAVKFDSHRVPDEVLAAALYQNGKTGVGKWEVRVKNDVLQFCLTYTALSAGLDAGAVKYICESIAKEASVFDSWLKENDYL